MTGPVRLRANLSDGVTEIRVLIPHPMETGQRLGARGEVVPAHYITEVVAEHNGRRVLVVHMGPSVSSDPFLVFRFRGGASGDTVKIDWTDNAGERGSGEVQIQ